MVRPSVNPWLIHSPCVMLGIGNMTADASYECTDTEYGDAQFMVGVVDLVQVPDLPDGDYVVIWRWDCEQTKQVK